jgi:hypothetical protein
MAYSFNYDFSKLPKEFFKDLARVVEKKELHRKLGSISKKLVEKFKIDKTFGIQLSDAISVVEDLIDIGIKNLVHEEDFKKAKEKILLLPHCSRKYMDSRCKAKFDPELSSYFCASCSKDCLINKATKLAKKKGYKVFVLPGGSCIKKILQKIKCDAILGVACPEEIRLASKILEKYKVVGKGLPLIRNGCANTKFNIESLKEILV